MSNDEKNMFGGGNANSVYIPMSDVEQEAINRLIEEQLLTVDIVGWGYIQNPHITLGDKRVSVHLDMTFNAPDIPMEVHYFDFVLKRGNYVLFQERHRTYYNHKPIMVGSGTNLNMIWDIAIARIDPKLVKMLVPHARGLTSRLTDKDTGEMTTFGNMKLSSIEKQVAMKLKSGEENVKKINRKDVVSATNKATHK
jgi:hypothetical protein